VDDLNWLTTVYLLRYIPIGYTYINNNICRWHLCIITLCWLQHEFIQCVRVLVAHELTQNMLLDKDWHTSRCFINYTYARPWLFYQTPSYHHRTLLLSILLLGLLSKGRAKAPWRQRRRFQWTTWEKSFLVQLWSRSGGGTGIMVPWLVLNLVM